VSPARVAPPDGEFVTLSIGGVQDPDGDPVQITVTDLTQNEPLRYRPCGDAAGIGTSHPDVRAVRDDKKRGRVYRISFRADDGRGGQCTARVTACVPGRATDATCLDDGSMVSSMNAACTGLCAAACGAERTLGHVSCSGERIPEGLARQVGKARRLMVRTAKAKRSAGAVAAALRALDRAVHLASSAAGAKKISASCAAGIDQILGNAHSQMQATSALIPPSATVAAQGRRWSARPASRGHASHRSRAASTRR
jgi:hypothetical protein